MVIIDMAVAFFMGALSGMGIGGGGLLVNYLTLIRHVGQTQAQGVNLYFFLFASAAALFVHCRRRKISYSTVLTIAAAGLPTALAGSLTATASRPELLRSLFGIMLILAGGLSLLSTARRFCIDKKERKK